MLVFAVAVAISFQACSPASGNHPGSEYMPDMGHSVAYEANVITEYYQNTWDAASVKTVEDLSKHNRPVNGTVPRGYAAALGTTGDQLEGTLAELRGETQINSINVPLNGVVPYYIPDTEEGRTYAATAPELRNNPFPITEDGLARGKELYNIFCGICHGEKGDGAGYLARDDSAYPAAPSNYLTDEFVNAENGRYMHAIMYGKGVMGNYKDKLSYEERWQVIHYIRALQAKDKKLAYDQYENTLNSWAVPYADTDASVDLDNNAMAKEFKGLFGTADKHKGDADHGHGHGHDEGHHGDGHGHEGDHHGDAHAQGAAVGKTITLENVYFKTGSADLEAKSKIELNTLAALLDSYGSVKIELGGHTDSDGDDGANLSLSEARASSVRNYLMAKGIEGGRLVSKGYGETKPVGDNRLESGKAKNRRTEVTILGQ